MVSSLMAAQSRSMSKPSVPQQPVRPSGDVAVVVPPGHVTEGELPSWHSTNLQMRAGFMNWTLREGPT